LQKVQILFTWPAKSKFVKNAEISAEMTAQAYFDDMVPGTCAQEAGNEGFSQ
jgi:hypothetical protein